MNNGKFLDGSNILNTWKNRFYSYVSIPDKENDCMLWIGGKNPDGYGIMRIRGKKIKSYRLSYEMHVGKIPQGLSVCHSCDRRECVNPNHLWVGTHQENIKDRDKKKRGHFVRENSHFKKGSGFSKAQFGEEKWNSILTNEKVIQIRNMIAQGFTQKEIAVKFDVETSNISRINTGKYWAHVKSEHTFPINKGIKCRSKLSNFKQGEVNA